jgi:hypothetical protein
MPTVTVRYTLPEEQAQFDAAQMGSKLAALLWDIDQHCRKVVKYEMEPSEDRVKLAEEIRQMIVEACPDALEL